MPQPVFASYAHADRDPSLERFIAEIRKELRFRGGHQASVDLVFFDRDGVEAGEEWSEAISIAVGRARVLICLVSPSYLKRDWCGRELQVFLERLSKAEGQVPPSIFPIIWEPTTQRRMPKRIAAIQLYNANFPAAYASTGVRRLARQRRWSLVNQVVDALADVIHKSLQSPRGLPALYPLLNAEEIVSAFDEQLPYDVKSLNLVPGGDTYRPFASDGSIRDVLRQVRDARDVYVRPLQPGPTLLADAQRAVSEKQVLLVIAKASLPLPPEIETLNSIDLPGLALLLVGGDHVPSRLADVLGQMPTGAFAVANTHGLVRIASEGALFDTADAVIDDARIALQRSDPVTPVRNQHLSEAASRLGIPIESRPGLTGPTGVVQ